MTRLSPVAVVYASRQENLGRSAQSAIDLIENVRCAGHQVARKSRKVNGRGRIIRAIIAKAKQVQNVRLKLIGRIRQNLIDVVDRRNEPQRMPNLVCRDSFKIELPRSNAVALVEVEWKTGAKCDTGIRRTENTIQSAEPHCFCVRFGDRQISVKRKASWHGCSELRGRGHRENDRIIGLVERIDDQLVSNRVVVR